MTKRYVIFILFVYSTSISYSQGNDSLRFVLTTSVSEVGVGRVKTTDPYLSPSEYKGTAIRVMNNSRRFLKNDNEKLSWTRKSYLEAGLLYHPTGSNSMMLFNTNFSYGLNFHFRPMHNLMLIAGGNCEIDFGAKYLGRNVNNPISVDAFSNLNLTAEAQYIFNILNQEFRAIYGAETPLVGYMFVPLQNVTYYELFRYNSTNNIFHFSSLHNKQAWSHYLNIDMPFDYHTIRLSAKHEQMNYKANNMLFKKSNIMVSIGSVVYFHSIKGKKYKMPQNFVQAYE